MHSRFQWRSRGAAIRRSGTAIRSQLIEKYCTLPESDGYGIYLVLWYGETAGCRFPKRNGAAIESASELKENLEDAIPSDSKHRISIVVVDVSNPAADSADS